MKYLKLYEGFTSTLKDNRDEINRLGDLSIEISNKISKLSDKITADFVNNLEKIKDFIRAYGIDWKEFKRYRNEIYYELKFKTNIFNYENITGISCNKNEKRRLFIHSINKTGEPDWDAISLVDNEIDYKQDVLVHILDLLEKDHPEFFEGEAMGFFNIK